MRQERYLARLASWENLEENLRSICTLSASSARSARRLSFPALRVPSLLSGCSLTRAKRENGAKRTFEVRKPFLSQNVEKRESLAENREK